MHLENFDVPILAQRGGHCPGQGHEQVHAEGHVAGLHDPRVVSRGLELREIVVLETRRPDDVDNAGLGRERRKRHGCRRRREVEHPVGLGEHRQRILGDRDLGVTAARQEPGILAERERALSLDGTDEPATLRLVDHVDERTPHAPGRADHDESHLGHARLPVEVPAVYRLAGGAQG